MPDELIALRPSERRDASRLMVLGRYDGITEHHVFHDLPVLLAPRSLLVLNDTRVMPARLRGRKSTGGQVEVLLLRRHDDPAAAAAVAGWSERWEVLARGLAGLRPGAAFGFGEHLSGRLLAHGDRGVAVLEFASERGEGLLDLAQSVGEVPLPPYIEAARRRSLAAPASNRSVVTPDDRERYQTVFARTPGAVAAPTAGLHFTPELLARVAGAGHEVATLTLHVGPGTFRPIEVDDWREHKMDAEPFEVPPATAAAVQRARAEGRPVVAVGTTVVRALESAALAGYPSGLQSTELFIQPGFAFRAVTDLITNFHLPRSTLLLLVAALTGRDPLLGAYAEAIAHRYRFYSYGDAMFVRSHPATAREPQP